MICGEIIHQRLNLCDSHVVADTIDYLEAQFLFKTDDWNGLDKWAHFTNSAGTVYDICLTDDCIRKEDHLNLSAGMWKVYLHGNEIRDGEVVQRITTDEAVLYVSPTGTLNGEPFPEIPASVAEQAFAAARAAKDAAGRAEKAVDEVDETVADALRQAKESGEFDGEPGKGLVILGTYATVGELAAAITNPEQGDMYNVGVSDPYTIYMWDAILGWTSQGKLQGETGAVYTPSVDANGDLSWANNGGLTNPPAVNIKGDKGDPGDSGVFIGAAADMPPGTKVRVYPSGGIGRIPVIDDTLTRPGAAADAAAVGQKFRDLLNNSGFINNTVSDLVNYYTKSQTYTQAEINQLISAIPKFAISVVSVLPTSGISTTTVYLVKSGTGGDLYTEYIYVNGVWEILGSQRVDLTGYATEDWVTDTLADYLPTAQLTAAINTALTQAKESGEFDGAPGEPGVSPTVSVSTITGGHRITITDKSSTKTVDVMDGADGDPGEPGDPGRGIVSVIRTSGTGAAGTTDTYTITYTDGTTSTFGVYNGKDGTPYTLTDADKADIAEMVDVPDVDSTLKVSGAAADAAKVGTEIGSLSEAIVELDESKADGIIESATGEVIAVSDSAASPLRGLVVYGKSTQDGTPTPDAPVPIVSAFEDGGGVAVTGKNLIPGAGRGYSGLTATNNADGSVTVSGSVAADGSALVYLFSSIETSNYTKIWFNPTRPLKVTLYKDGAIYTNTFTTRYKTRDGVSKYTPVSGAYFDAVYIQRTVTAGDTSLCGTYQVQVEVGSVATDYEPYTGQTLPISTPDGLCGIPVTSGGNYTDANGQRWVCDEVDFGRGVRVQRVNTVVLDGTESITEIPVSSTGKNRYRVEKILPKSASTRGLCSCCTMETTSGYTGEKNLAQVANDRIYLGFVNYQTLADVKSILSSLHAAGTPFVIVYQLSAPIETPLTEEELAAYKALRTNYPYTTIYADDNAGLSVAYKVDTKAYIDKKFAELATAIVNA